MGLKISIEAFVYPTEDADLVKIAVENIFDGDIALERDEGCEVSKVIGVSGHLNSLSPLREILRRDRIRAAARAVLLSSISKKEMKFYLNKQVAHVGHVSFCQPERESPLGPITITVIGEDLMAVVDWFTRD